ncbi:MAG: endolytic transglycosylase MltG [Pseudomonadota bacterium]
MWRHIASNALTFFVVSLFILGGVILWGIRAHEAPGPGSQAFCLQVDRGSTMNRVATELADRGAIRSEALFSIGADYADLANALKAGSFLIPAAASEEEILTIITDGGASTCGTEVNYRIGVTRTTVVVREIEPETGEFIEVTQFDPAETAAPASYGAAKEDTDTRFRITVAEGVTSWQIATALRDIDTLSGALEEVPGEGLLAPDSYSIRPGDTRSDLTQRMLAAQETRLATAWAARAGDLPIETPEEALILASIVEKETSLAEERPTVASVFTNRLRQRMLLQTDPTVIYGITRGQGVLGRGLRRSELRRETPWNTYVISGLPPTPIANPGLASIEAVLNPAETDYIFFVADGTGGHAFAVTLDEHNRNVARWRQIEAERSDQ